MDADRHFLVLASALIVLCAMGCSGSESDDVDALSDVVSDDVLDSDTSETVATDAEEEEIPAIPPPPPTQPVVDFETDNLFDAPYPSDLRRQTNGRLDLSKFPNPKDVGFIKVYIELSEEVLKGFGLTPSISFRFSDKLDTGTMPLPKASEQLDSPVQLINLDENSPDYGKRMPVEISWWGKNPAVYIQHNTMTFHPLFGIPLTEGTRYAAFATTAIKDPYGRPLETSEIIQQALQGQGALAEHLAPFAAWVQSDPNVALEDVAVATVFTTDVPTVEMRAIAKYIQDELEAPQTTELVQGDLVKSGLVLYEGRYDSPNFQAGEKPYITDGDIRFDDNGKPIVQLTENLRFALTVPKLGEMPEKGWPLVLYGHGTGGDWKTFITTTGAPALQLTDRGFAVLGIDQPLHGDRYEDSENVELLSFNFLNPWAARSNFRQSAIDVLAQVRYVRESLVIPADISHTGQAIQFDPDNIFFFGHSHGGISGGIFGPLEPNLKAIILSGAGGGLSHAIIVRKDIVDFQQLVETQAKIENPLELSLTHPILALVQNLIDATDPLSYAPFYQNPGDGRKPLNLLMTEGTNDKQTAPITTDSLASAARIPIIEPAAHESLSHFLLGMDPIPRPVQGNYTNEYGAATAVLAHFNNASHWAVFEENKAIKTYTSFLKSALGSDLPKLE